MSFYADNLWIFEFRSDWSLVQIGIQAIKVVGIARSSTFGSEEFSLSFLWRHITASLRHVAKDRRILKTRA